VKVLPDFFAHDSDRRARFEEEARALAALNHPHIGAIYGLEESGDVAALVLELIDGPTLAERLIVGPLPLDDALRIARQLADGLEAAHDRGIIHRDLKPANIKITPEGNAKILDFGLAKAAVAMSSPAARSSPGSRNATAVGAIVGTAGYMSPEQAQGQPVDKRTDIWAFGCVLFEMCAGRPAFAGVTASETLAAVIEREPDWGLLPARTPPTVVRLIRRCLTKDQKTRLRDIGEARIALMSGTDQDPVHSPAGVSKRLMQIATVAGALAVGATVGGTLYRTSPVPLRFEIPAPEAAVWFIHPGQVFFALSPDGSQMAVLAREESGSGASGSTRIWLRALADLQPRPLGGTEGATSMFWSPDGRSLAFVADHELKRIDLSARSVVKICNATAGAFTHGTWGAGDVILLGTGPGTDIESVPARGGEPKAILGRDRARREDRVHFPWFLPDGNRFLYTARLADGEGELRLGRLDGSSRAVMRVSSNTQWVDPDIVVFARDGVLMGQRVDLDAVRPIGRPFAIAQQVEYFSTSSRAMFSASRKGAVAYHAGGDLGQLVWADGNGREVGTIGGLADYHQSARLSRDDTSLLTARRQPGPGTYDIWRLDLVRRTEEKLTAGRGSELSPVWIGAGRAIVFSGDSGGFVPHLFYKDLATGDEEELLSPGRQQLAMDVFPGDRAIAYVEQVPAGFGMFTLPMAPRGLPISLRASPLSAWDLRLSPDGYSMAFIAQDGNRRDIYIALVDATSAPVLAAQGVSGPPRWSRDGGQVYFVGRDDMLKSVVVRTRPSLEVGTVRSVFAVKRRTSLMDVARDGRFLLLVPHVRAAERPIVVGTAAIESARRAGT
jgi:Tol biopolymer transport system component